VAKETVVGDKEVQRKKGKLKKGGRKKRKKCNVCMYVCMYVGVCLHVCMFVCR
jgi:hypothetical protein